MQTLVRLLCLQEFNRKKMKSVLTSYFISEDQQIVVQVETETHFYSVESLQWHNPMIWASGHRNAETNVCYTGLWFQAVNTAILCTVAANTSCCADVWQSSHHVSAPITKWNQSGETVSSTSASNTQFRKHDMSLCLGIIVKLKEKKAGRFGVARRE